MNSTRSECPICVEAYTDKIRQTVTCKYCLYKCCTVCVKTYLLSTSDDPHCMNCRRGWDRDFLYDILTKSFVNSKLRKHRKCLLLEREKAKIPETQSYVNFLLQKREKEHKMKEIKKKINELWLEYDVIVRSVRTIESHPEDLKSNKRMLKCQYSDCRGYLTGSKCNICKHTTCRDCISITDIDSNGNVIEEKHVCNEDAKKTAEMILNETKPCPSCSERIYKISGCDQMWCTQCNVAFSWNSGTMISGTVHNPHYYQWLANNGTQNPPIRNAGDVVCGGLIHIATLYGSHRIHEYLGKNDVYERIINLHRSISHTQDVIVNVSRQKLQHKINEKLRNSRAEYIMQNIDEDKWSRKISTLDSEREKEQALLHVYETYCTILTERFNNFIEEGRRTRNYKDLFIQLEQDIEPIISYLNEQLKRISYNYNVSYYGFYKCGVICLNKTKKV